MPTQGVAPAAPQPDPLEGLNWDEPGAIKVSSSARKRSRWRRRSAGGVGGLILAALGIFIAVPGVRSHVPANVPLVGKDADSVWAQIRDSGLAVENGVPSSPRFRRVAESNVCKSSHSFVQSGADTGWAIICVKPPGRSYRSLRESLSEAPALLAPMWVDQDDGEVIVFGMGWPGQASRQIARAIGGNASYLTFDR